MNQNYIILLIIGCTSVISQEVPSRRYVVRYSNNPNITKIDERHPYIVSLLDKGTIRECTGALIRSEWVITAAHCIVHNDITHIQYGNMSIPPRNTEFKSAVREKIQHPRYQFGDIMTYDIGLLFVRPVPLKRYAILSSMPFSKLLGRRVEYAGLGIRMTQKMLRMNYRIETLVLVQTRPIHMSQGIVTSCRDIILIENPNNFFCVQPICNRNITKLPIPQCVNIHFFAEDSGGPLFHDMKLVGVTSWGATDRAIPAGVFTAVGPYKAWILFTMRFHSHYTPGSSIAKRLQQSLLNLWKRLTDFSWLY